jgi:hypothetical protein
LTGDDTHFRTNPYAYPLFLISLKAGGVGLNVTAVDTVIHYDPWWNPAVEHQAADRAHRLGQDKPVFVYKLITAGSVEEKIVAMQEQKAALADAILSEDAAGAVKFSADDLEALFEPIPLTTSISPAAKSRPRTRTGTWDGAFERVSGGTSRHNQPFSAVRSRCRPSPARVEERFSVFGICRALDISGNGRF